MRVSRFPCGSRPSRSASILCRCLCYIDDLDLATWPSVAKPQFIPAEPILSLEEQRERESWKEKRTRQESNERNKEVLVRAQKGTSSANNK